ncbi:hypothetical protein C8Q79DRAFT_692823 [Trametes meyenii]|nr:hypothetical protein C8Q79DRAFT_692823 [Trametes meyenii]
MDSCLPEGQDSKLLPTPRLSKAELKRRQKRMIKERNGTVRRQELQDDQWDVDSSTRSGNLKQTPPLSGLEEATVHSPAASSPGFLNSESLAVAAGTPGSNPSLQGLPLTQEARGRPQRDLEGKDQVIQQNYILPPATWDQVRNSVLNTSIASGRFKDLLLVFSPERPAHRGCPSLAPRELYANRTLVKHALLRARFLSLDITRDIEGEHVEPDAMVDTYYSDDSDLEDADCRDDASDGPDGGDKASDILADDYYTDPKSKQPRTDVTIEDQLLSTGPQEPSSMVVPAEHRAKSSLLETLVVKDTAYRTWNALVFYAYTHQIKFLPLKSQGRAAITDVQNVSEPPACSPKSMYRMAMKYGNTELQALAIHDIRTKLSTQNILEELFSRFTSRYPEIQTMQLDFVFAHLKHSDITAGLPLWVNRFGRGELKECVGTFSQFFDRLVSNVSQG